MIITICFIFTVDVPDKPEGPVEFSNITKDSVTLSWQPPTKDGGLPLTGYVIEQRDKRRTQWVKAGTVDKDTTSFTAAKLLEDNEYVFRVLAVNAEGESEPLESKDVAKPTQPLCKLHFFNVEYSYPALLISPLLSRYYLVSMISLILYLELLVVWPISFLKDEVITLIADGFLCHNSSKGHK